MIKGLFVFSIFLFTLSFAQADSVQIEKQVIESLDNLAHLDAERMQLEQKIQDLESKIRERKKVLNQRARALSYLKRFQWGGLLATEEPHQIERNLKIVKGLNQYDINLFKEYKNSLKSLALARTNLAETQKQLEQILADLQNQQTQLSTFDNERKTKLISENTNSLLKLKGELARPLVGAVALPFGSRPDKQNQYVFVNKGLLYKSVRGQAIKSIGPGIVIFRDHIPHWRETLIVQHDDNYYSVYAGIYGSQKKLQDRVETGEEIAFAGTNEFYFELRHFENPINPALWFKESL